MDYDVQTLLKIPSQVLYEHQNKRLLVIIRIYITNEMPSYKYHLWHLMV